MIRPVYRIIETGCSNSEVTALSLTTSSRYQVASDINRDGLGLELLDASDNVVAEVFRCDADNTLYLNTFAFDISVQDIDALLARAREELGSFEDGAPLSEARPMAPRRIELKG